MRDNVFIDTNVLVYAYFNTDSFKHAKSVSFLENHHYDYIISAQVLSEFCNVGIKKMKSSVLKIQNNIEAILADCDLAIISEKTIYKALSIQEKHKFSYYDSLIISSALENGCKYLLSEDLTNKQEIEGLVIRNIFIA
jgi:predicted nucleic acid-binding protein